MNDNERFTLGQRLVVSLVSLYLLATGAFLLMTGRVKVPSFTRVLRAALARPYSGEISGFSPEAGKSFVATVPARLLCDRDSISTLALYEDGRPLGPAHAAHADIRAIGGGRFSHWGSALYFSTSDGSDPRTNGRRYTVREERHA